MPSKMEKLIDDIQAAINEKEAVDATSKMAAGKDLRKRVPRKSQGVWETPRDRPDPVELIKEQGKSRVAELLPIRYARMAESPFAFYRGNAVGMASDLSRTPTTGITVQACGDAHVANFGIFNSPEGRLVFDVNDFDETFRAPWEWDVKRLVASLQICSNVKGLPNKTCRSIVASAASGYREAMGEFAQMGTMDVWNTRLELDEVESLVGVLDDAQRKAATKTVEKAKTKDSSRAIAKLTEVKNGERRIISQPPLLVPLRDMLQSKTGIDTAWLTPEAMGKLTKAVLSNYAGSLSAEKRLLLSQYHGVDMGRKVVGVGSVGTRCWIVVLQGVGDDDYLVLQIKEAQRSVLEKHASPHVGLEGGHGRRVVEGQRAMQSVSDPLLGYTKSIPIDGTLRDFYVRQLWNGKGSPDLDRISADGLMKLAHACGWTLARAHARTGDRFMIAGYLGQSTAFDDAMCDFAEAYSTQNALDYQEFKYALDTGGLELAGEK